MNTTEVLGWMGLAFELICLQHHQQIKDALKISGAPTAVYSWRKRGDRKKKEKGAQIDMMIERSDSTIHLCEMKFCNDKYALTPDYEQHIRERAQIFREATCTTKALLHTFVTTYGLKNPTAFDTVHSEITMDDLFNS